MRFTARIETVCGALLDAATVHESGVALNCDQLPLSIFASYLVIAAPFICSGATHVVVIEASPATEVTDLGADGTAAGVAATLVDAPHPSKLHARTYTVYAVPF